VYEASINARKKIIMQFVSIFFFVEDVREKFVCACKFYVKLYVTKITSMQEDQYATVTTFMNETSYKTVSQTVVDSLLSSHAWDSPSLGLLLVPFESDVCSAGGDSRPCSDGAEAKG
jgi:hypothetical protein